ncbi:MAG: hypothetical protein J2O48_10725, partial [Solirubrobacterales bacterium]|nr:hypothetical protein [Solirubrobacterales bacterium]
GVPVIIDDALGHSDPARLPKLWAALRNAGEGCQVIVLTCEEARYRGVSGAKLVQLGPGSSAASELAALDQNPEVTIHSARNGSTIR